MAKATPTGLVIEYDNNGGTLVDITQHVQTINEVEIEGGQEETHGLGDSWEETLATGIAKMAPVELSGLYDDVATTGPDALFAGRLPEGPSTPTRTLKITWRSGKTTTVETFLTSYKRTADRNNLTRYTVKLQPTGAVTEV